MRRTFIILAGIVSLAMSAWSQTDTCGSSLPVMLADGSVAGLQEARHLPDPCSLAVRLDEFRKWLLSRGQPCSTVVNAITDRSLTLRDTTTWPIDTTGVVFAGQPAAPVEIIMYLSASCPLCKHLYREVHAAVTTGELRGVARLGVKPFSTTPMDLALLASAAWGRQADLLIALAPVKTRLTTENVLDVLDSLGVPRQKVQALLDSPKLKAYAQASRSEAQANEVTVTPTYFIDRRRYRGHKNTQWLVDAARFRFACRHPRTEDRRR